MKIAVTATGNTPDAEIDPRFGQTRYILVFDGEQRLLEVIDNPGNRGAMSGAGVQTARNLADRKVDILLTGRLGPNAAAVLNAAGIKVATDQSGTVRDALERLNRNEVRFSLDSSAAGFPPSPGGPGRGVLAPVSAAVVEEVAEVPAVAEAAAGVAAGVAFRNWRCQ